MRETESKWMVYNKKKTSKHSKMNQVLFCMFFKNFFGQYKFYIQKKNYHIFTAHFVVYLAAVAAVSLLIIESILKF